MSAQARLLLTIFCLALVCAVHTGVAQEAGDRPCAEADETARPEGDGDTKADELTKEEADKLLKVHRKLLDSVAALTLDDIRSHYKEADKHKAIAGFSDLRDSWALALANKADPTTPSNDLADVATCLKLRCTRA